MQEKEVYGVFAVENLDEMGQEEQARALGGKQWNKLQKALKDIVVSEVYSQPRVAKQAEDMGMRAGSSIAFPKPLARYHP